MQTRDDAIRVLYVDDEPDFAEMAATFLEREDDRFEIETATSASEGLDRLAEDDFQCVVSDYDMPGQNGIEFLEAVRENRPALPFVLHTGKGSEEVASEAISAGVTDYLQKGCGTDRYALLANRIVNAIEHYLAEQEADWHRTIIRNMGEGVYVLDSSYTIRYVKFRESEIDGLSEEDWAGRSLSYLAEIDILSSDEIQRVRDEIDRILNQDVDETSIEIEPAVPDSTRTLSLRLTSVPSRNGRDLVLGTSRDITERKEREQELERQNEQLEEFAGVVSHDIRNPLTIAQGRPEFVRAECDSEHIDPIDRALTRIDALIDDLLTLARDGDRVSETESLDLADLSEECWQTVETADATIRAPVDRTVRADRSRFAQLLENLIRNAVEHGGGDVTVTVGELDDGFYVEDDGSGIPESERADVFDAGYSTTEDGTGFGLNIVERVAEAHGWDVHVTEGTNGGARFEITGVAFSA